MGYLKHTIKGVSWMGALRLTMRSLTLIRLAILARILVPSQFGAYGIALIVLGFLEILTETGINLVLIQEKEDVDEYINTSWVVSIIRGILISVLILISAPFISIFFNSPDSYKLLLFVAVVPFVRGFINPSIVKLQKDLNFSGEFVYRSSVFLVDTVSSILFSMILRSPVGLMLGLLTGTVYEVIYTFLVARPLPRLAIDVKKILYILNKGKWVTGYGIFDYIYTQGDNVVVGRLLGEYSLGMYQNAYKISLIPLTEFGDVLYKVTLPVFVKISDDKERLKRAFIKNVLATIAIVVPVGLIIFYFSREIVEIVLGNNWLEAVPVVQLLSFLGIIRGVSNSANSLFVATQNQKYVTTVTFISVVVLAITIFPLTTKFGIMGAGISAFLSAVAAVPVNLFFVSRILNKK